jgi:hypothetical protein
MTCALRLLGWRVVGKAYVVGDALVDRLISLYIGLCHGE